MEKNYYEILQVDKNASPEIIEKVYKTLAKQYHPDLQSEENKKNSEEIFKKINEAYETLSDPSKKAIYDKNIENQYITIDEYNKIYNQNILLKKELDNVKNYYTTYLNNLQTNYNNYQNNLNYSYQSKPEPAHDKINPSKRKIYYRRDTENFDNSQTTNEFGFKNKIINIFKNILSIILVIIILYLLLQIPFIKNLVNNNPIIQSIIKIFSSLFSN